MRVGWDPLRQEYIIRAPGGHIIGCTADPAEVLEAIRFESEWGYGSMELRLQGCTYCETYHGLGARRRVKPTPRAKATLTLEDLGL